MRSVPRVELRVLGAGDLRRIQDGLPESVHLQPKRLALLACLALTARDGWCRRDVLLSLLWQEQDQAQARNALNQSLHALRGTLTEQVLVSRGIDEIGVDGGRFWCDAVAFEVAHRAADHSGAVELYRGELLPGVHVHEAPEFEHWLERERERLRRLASRSARHLAAASDARGDLEASVRWLARLSEIEPADEQALRQLVRAQARSGNRAQALKTFRDFERRLDRELDLAPEQETLALVQQIRRGTNPSLGADSDGQPPPSIVVLPFANLSGDPEQDYMSDGMTEEITNLLAQVDGLEVAARSSAYACRHRGEDLREMSRALGVMYALEGSVRTVGHRMRVIAQLIQLPGGFHVFSQEYDANADDVLRVQADVARRVVRQLRGALASESRFVQVPTHDREAYDLYLKGRFLWTRRNATDAGKAIRYLEESVERDPSFAQAHAALGAAYAILGAVFQDVLPSRSCIPRARSALDRALGLDPHQAEAHAMRGILHGLYEWDWQAAERSIRRALSLAPRSGVVWLARATVLIYAGRAEEAAEAAAAAVRLEPFVLTYRETHSIALYLTRRYDRALEVIRENLVMDQRAYVSTIMHGDTLTAVGRCADALEAYRYAIELAGRTPALLAALGRLHALRGEPEAARAVLSEMEELSSAHFVRPTYFAYVVAALGEHEEALNLLERAAAERDLHVACINSDPFFDPLRAQPRFRALLRKVGPSRDGAYSASDRAAE